MALLPISVSPHGHLGTIITRFLYDEDPLPLLESNFAPDRTAALQGRPPRHLRQDPSRPPPPDIWRPTHPSQPYGGTHHTACPSRYFDQELGLVISTAISSHLLRAYGPRGVCDNLPAGLLHLPAAAGPSLLTPLQRVCLLPWVRTPGWMVDILWWMVEIPPPFRPLRET